MCVCASVVGCTDSASDAAGSTTAPPTNTTATTSTTGASGTTGPSGATGATGTGTTGANGAVTVGNSANSGGGGDVGSAQSATDGGSNASMGGAGGGGASSSAGGASDTSAQSTTSGAAGAEPGPSGVLGIIAVGYGGLRIVTRDLGETWENESHWSEDGGDDHDLLRTIAYGNGIWVSGGWRITTSEDGVEWTDRGDAEDVIEAINCQVTDGMAFGGGKFLVACGSTLAASVDGLDWERVGSTPDVGGHPHLVFDAATEQFACSGDDGNSYVSSDGEDWTEVDIDTVRLCEELAPEDECPSFYYDGVYLSTEWGGWIRRSTNGSNFMTTYSDAFGSNLFTEYSFAVGLVAP